MANTIKLKRGSGSDPSASDLEIGEIAIRTDTGKLFTKKDNNSVAEISGGISDGDKGDITVSNSGATLTIDDDAVTYAKIQNVSATNRILGRDSSGAGVIEEITPANLRTMLNVADGATNVTNTNQLTNGAGFITATLTNEQVQDIVGGMVSGNTESGITVTYQDSDGTLDFSVASQTDNNFTNADHSKLDGIESNATADQTAAEIKTLLNSNQLATAQIANNAITADKIPNAEVTFAKLQNVSQNRIVGRVSSGSGVLQELTAANIRSIINVEDGATADQTASEILTLIKTVDGAGSGLDADTLDGVSAGGFLSSDNADTADGDITFNGGAGAATIAGGSDIRFTNGNWTGNSCKIQHHSDYLYIQSGSNGHIFRNSNGSNRWLITASGNFEPDADSTYNIGSNSVRVANGYFDTLYGDGSNLTGISAGGATGGGSDEVFYENDQTVTTNYTITNGKNAMAAGPITINSGVTVTVGSGETLTIV